MLADAIASPRLRITDGIRNLDRMSTVDPPTVGRVFDSRMTRNYVPDSSPPTNKEPLHEQG